MALFAFWRDGPSHGSGPHAAAAMHRRLLGEAHVAPDLALCRDSLPGGWCLSAFATDTRYYPAPRQLWCDAQAGACVIHGLLWREERGEPRLLDAAAVARLLDAPGATLPDDVCGEYAVARLYPSGALAAFGDRAGLHHLFYADAGPPIVANRAGFVATMRDDWRIDREALRWLPTIGYRVGANSGWAVARQLPQEQQLLVEHDRLALRPLPQPVVAFARARGFDDALFEQGLVQARAAVRLATDGTDAIALPITGGKDSRAVLALCLAAGLRDRLTLFTRGYDGHPDVIAGRGIAAALGLPHDRQPPLGSDAPALLDAETFVRMLAVQAYQTDGMMGGWDHIAARRLGRETLITGHMGEVLKAYSKKPLGDGPLGPVAMVRLQAPFDPIGLLRPHARAALTAELAGQLAHAAAAGAEPADQPDIFYYRNRIPNWLGGIRGIKSFERQPVMPLGVPALMRLAFRMTPAERQMERAHHAIVRACAPELVALPFALQRWDARLGAHDATLHIADPVLPAAGAPPVFGNWQYSLNQMPRVRHAIAGIVAAHDGALWESFDRDALATALHARTFDYFDGISLLGLLAALFHEAGAIRPDKLAHDDGAVPPIRLRATDDGHASDWDGVKLADAPGATGRPIAPALRRRLEHDASPGPLPTLYGHVDRVHGLAATNDGWRIAPDAVAIAIEGWVHAPALPGARLAVEARCGDAPIASATADRPRPDLARAGHGDGAYGFTLTLDPAAVRGAAHIVVRTVDGGFVPIGGTIGPIA